MVFIIILVSFLHKIEYWQMFKDSNSKLMPNQLLATKQDDYTKPSKIKAKIKNRGQQRFVLEDTTNKLQSMQNYAKPVSVDIEVHQSDKDSQNQVNNQKQEVRNDFMELVTFQNQLEDQSKQYNNSGIIESIKEDLGLKSNLIKQKMVESQIDDQNMDPQMSRVEEQAKIAFQRSKKDKEKKRSIPKRKKSIEQIVKERKMTILKYAQKNKKLFNLDIQSSSQNEEQKQKQLDQKKIQDFHQAKSTQFHNNEIKNIFDDNEKPKQRRNITKLTVNLSDSSQPQQKQQQQEQQPQRIEKAAVKRNIILKQFDSESDQQQQKQKQKQKQHQQQCEQKDNENKVIEQEFEQELEMIRNMNIQKLKICFQCLNLDPNYFAFCPIPPETKISLIVKRNIEKSQYIIFDSQLVCQIMKVQKSLGGVYKFFITNDAKDGKPIKKEIGKMKANFIGTQFHCYSYKEQDLKQKKQKYQCGSITYDVNILGLNGPRKIKIYTTERPIPSTTNLMQTYQKIDRIESSIKLYQSKTPKWMPQLNAYVLNLRGTASHSSIKNCIIVDSTNENKQFLIFGKKSKDIFNLEIKHPFTLFQGIAFAVSSFQKKLACE